MAAHSKPLSRASGFDRGTPVDRYYIDQFLERHRGDIRGDALEVGNDAYSRRYGSAQVSCQDVLDIKPGAGVTIVGDLAKPGALAENAYDCILLVQTLQYVFDLPVAIDQLRRALRPGGVLLLTVPALAPVSLDPWQDTYYWRFSVQSLLPLLGASFGDQVEVSPFGNLYAATLFLHGAAVEEASKAKLQRVMPEYAVVLGARCLA